MDFKARTYARRKNVHQNVHQKAAAKPAPAADEGAPPGLAMESLLSLVGQMRKMVPDGSGTARNPKLILTGSGLEIRFSGAAAGAQIGRAHV